MKKILVVEDDAFIRDIAAIKLTEHSYGVTTASSGEEALALLQTNSYSAVLLDLDLPDISGQEVMKIMRDSETHAKTPVIIFSNNDNPDTRRQVTELGILGFFVKASTDFNELCSLIDALPE